MNVPLRHFHPTHFADSANGNNVPSGWFAAVYVLNGAFTWSEHNIHRMAGVFGISASSDPSHARYARCIDIEPGAGTPDSAPLFLHERLYLGHHDGMCYVNRSNWQATEDRCLAGGFHPEWWVAAPGLSPEECANLRSPVAGVKPVAVQNFWGQAYDLSVLIGDLTFTAPRDFTAV